ncbi:hypothetical protein HBN50_16090 [Halobacteriovorax sp. GB3]|nr:hypothetical protein [Halobacteriovorax sp. GB3]MDD0854634.1 hypothetical protein [Halobacteriovorax sp. GB3]
MSSNNFREEIFEALEEVKHSLNEKQEINEKHLEVLLLTSLLEEESK